MKTQRTTPALLKVILCVLALGCSVRADDSFFEDFSDGDVQDGSPVTWQWDANTGECLATPAGLQVTPAWQGERLCALRIAQDAYGRDLDYTGSMTIRAQVKIPKATTGYGSGFFMCLRANDDLDTGDSGYMVAINRQYFYLARIDGPDNSYSPWDWHYEMNGRFDATEDVMIQLDVIDLTDTSGNRTTSRLEGRWWVPGQEMPVQPQVVAYDAKYDAGGIEICTTAEVELNRTVIIRWIEVTGTQVEPIVDFNGNGTVDIKDLVKLIECWGQSEPTVDIVPDGVIDVNDLEVLMEYWQQDVNDPTLLTHWKLDETEGNVAYETVAQQDATVSGEAVWQPESGHHEGALAFDGINDCIETPFVLDPAAGVFSLFVWVKGGTPGQVVLSQVGGANWLGLDQAGNLFTDLKGQGRWAGQSLHSNTSITDGQWHRVGLVWDFLYRSLYVDDQLVAADVASQDNFSSATGGLCLGAQSTPAAGTFWSGMMDDVRIYNRVVAP
jgi:hypothetical protein